MNISYGLYQQVNKRSPFCQQIS